MNPDQNVVTENTSSLNEYNTEILYLFSYPKLTQELEDGQKISQFSLAANCHKKALRQSGVSPDPWGVEKV